MKQGSRSDVLIFATLWWPSAARLATAFLAHHCSVSALCPPGHPLRVIRGVGQNFPYQGLATMDALAHAIRTAQPEIIVPCDDMAVWQLHALHAVEPSLRPIIERSLGAADAYPVVQQRAEMLRIAEGLGIRVPVTKVLHSEKDLEKWPFDGAAVLKMDGTWGGEGVTVVHSRAEAAQVYRSSPRTLKAWMACKRHVINRHAFAFWTWRRRVPATMTIQEFIPGRPATTMFACWRGEVLGSSTVEVLASQSATGAANVVRVIQHDEIETAVRRLARELQLSGFHGLDFMLDRETNEAYLLELNPRATQLGHLNLSGRGDLAGVMAAKLRNHAPETAVFDDRLQQGTIAFFPHAFKTNPESIYLRQGYHDVPWSEPALVRELLRDSWPERQWTGRLYKYSGIREKFKLKHVVSRPFDPKPLPRNS